MATAYSQGKQALANKEYDEAVKKFTEALKVSPTSPDYLIQRSTAYQRAQQYDQALEDAERAVIAAQTRAKREAIIEAQFRRGCSLFSMGRYGDAQYILGIVGKMNEKHNANHVWFNKAKLALRDVPEGDIRKKVTVKETPDLDAKPAPIEERTVSPAGTTNATSAPSTSTSTSLPSTAPTAPQQTSADKIRHDWYQNSDKIFFTLMAKGVPKDKAQADITKSALSISFPLVTGSDYSLTFDPLFGPVDPSSSTVNITPSKVEVVLAKATPGQKWKTLENPDGTTTASDAAVAGSEVVDDVVKRAAISDFKSTASGPAYPTSSKSGPKDWDKVAKSLHISDDPKKSSGTEDDDDDDAGGDEANAFFKKLFKGATPEAQRAMMKSYQESNGTALSTNWDEVSKGKVETTPPDGMEAKKWGT